MNFLTHLSLALAASSLASAFLNPIIPGFNPDPTVLAVGGDYFISTSSFEIFPAHPIYHSTDLIDWKLIGNALNRPSQLQLYGVAPEGGSWAPTLRKFGDTFYLITTNRWIYSSELKQFSRGSYVTTKDIFSDNWSDPIHFDTLGYDNDIFVDDDGTAYVTECGISDNVNKIYGIYQHTIDLATGQSTGPNRLTYNGTLPLDASVRPEAPHVHKRGEYYYLLIAEGGTGVTHRATVARGPTPSGPWEAYEGNPLIYNGANLNVDEQPVQATGHCDWIETPDFDWYAVCLGVRPQGNSTDRAQLGRETFLLPMTWLPSGWPSFNNNQSLALVEPGLYNRSLSATDYVDQFDGEKLDKSFYFLRTPYTKLYDLAARKGWLRVLGSPISIGDRDTPSLIMRKQTAFNQLFTTELDFYPSLETHEAGSSIFYSDFYHFDIGITLCPSSTNSSSGTPPPRLSNSTQTFTPSFLPSSYPPSFPSSIYASAPRCLFKREIYKNNGTNVVLANSTIVTDTFYKMKKETGTVRLAIQADNVRYSFGFEELGKEGGGGGEGVDGLTWVGAVDAKWLHTAPAGYGEFKGTHFGVFAQGKENSMYDAPADFAYWSQITTAPDF